MGSITTDTTMLPNHAESITGYRSGGEVGARAKYTCDLPLTAYDPFDFEVDWRIKYIKVYTKIPLGTGFYHKYVRKPVPYPYYKFVKKTRTVKAWRLEISAGTSVLGSLPQDFKGATGEIELRLKWIKDILKKYGPCRLIPPRSASVQHPVYHWKSEISSQPVIGVLAPPFKEGDYAYVTNNFYKHRFIEMDHENYDDSLPHNDATSHYLVGAWNSIMSGYCVTTPVNTVFDPKTVETVTAMLWPSSDDFENIKANPLIDLAEMAADMQFPLGPPPNAAEAHKRMVDKCLSDNIFGSITEVVDFAANAHLWTTLVLAPVVQGAVGLATSVEANDKAIEAYNKMAQTEKWQQGKSVRLFGRNPKTAATCFGAPANLNYSQPFGNSGLAHTLNLNLEYKKFTAQASMYYLLNKQDAVMMNTSGQRLGQFFNRLSSSLDTVLHNIIPLSFVYDWFTSEYSGVLDLKDKVYMPVSAWKVTMSYNLDVEVGIDATTVNGGFTIIETLKYWEYTLVDTYPNHPVLKGKYFTKVFTGNTVDSVTTKYYSGWTPPFGTTIVTIVAGSQTVPNDKAKWLVREFGEFKDVELKFEGQEKHTYYQREVFENPARRTNFESNDYGIACFDFSKPEAFEDTGKNITLAAIIWGLIPGGS
jgi:hypothetical protein